MRNKNNYKEIWVIPLCFDKTKKLESDKEAKTYFSKKSNNNNFSKTVPCKNTRKHLNSLYNYSEKNLWQTTKKIP